MKRLVASLLGCAIALCCRPAGAHEPAPLIVFYGPANPSTELVAARAAIERAARERGTAVIDLSPRKPALPQAPVLLLRGVQAYHDLDYEEALRLFEEALAEAEISGADGLAPSELADLYIYRGLVFRQRGAADRSWQDLLQAATIDPTRKLDAARFPPGVIESFSRAADAVNNAETSHVTVKAVSECRLFFDGRAVDATGGIVLPRGEHYLRLACPGFLPYGSRVLVQHREQRIKPTLRASAAPSRDAIVDAGRQHGVPAVIWATADESPASPPILVMRLLRVASKKETSRITMNLASSQGSPIDVEQQALRLIDRVVNPETDLVAEPSDGGGAPWYRRPWFWGVAGAALASAVLVPLAIYSEPASGFDIRVDYRP